MGRGKNNMILKKCKATVYIAVAIIVVFIIDTFLLSTSAFTADHLVYGNNFGLLTKYGRLVNYKEISVEIWRLVTNLFLHAGIPHLLVNLIALICIGFKIENIFETKRYLYIFFCSGIVASLVTMFFTNGSVGASGAIYGLAGAYVSLLITKKIRIRDKLDVTNLIVVILYLTLPNLSASTAISAHLTGFIMGFIMTVFIQQLSLNNC